MLETTPVALETLEQPGVAEGLPQSIFGGLGEDELAWLNDASISVQYQAGDLLFQQGAITAGIHVITEGLAAYGRRSGDGSRERIIKIVGPQDLLGADTLLLHGDWPHFGYARALTDMRVRFIDRDTFLDLLEARPDVAIRLCNWLARELLALEIRLAWDGSETPTRNLALVLLALARKFRANGGRAWSVELELKRSVLADLLGVSTESLIRALRELKEQGLVAAEGRKLVVLDPEGLAELAGLDPLVPQVL
ncbi:MAG: Crp/Fnr family transcriptional regulator [Candidatus Acetothermia bacterium]|jgi:CRP/FNR family transcriptional regulator|nr:Crp/Fnr family transcriptional regulator [Candidatus Acetothermia bacterium]MDH7504641.1 Crp/Fnr family transcriptional regulator [Candidatus Acetothermia bacterium]